MSNSRPRRPRSSSKPLVLAALALLRYRGRASRRSKSGEARQDGEGGGNVEEGARERETESLDRSAHAQGSSGCWASHARRCS